MVNMLIIKSILKKVNINPIFFFLAFTSIITGLFKDFLVFSSIILFHELGHILAALYYKWKIKQINFYPFGGYIEFNEILNKPIKEEMIIVISGLISQTLYFFIILFLYINAYVSENIYNLFKHYHSSILLFNLIPIFPLDGIKIINTKGHSKGSVSIYLEKEGIIFTGDTLFYGTCGRCDLWDSNVNEMKRSLLKIKDISNITKYYPGHGYSMNNENAVNTINYCIENLLK